MSAFPPKCTFLPLHPFSVCRIPILPDTFCRCPALTAGMFDSIGSAASVPVIGQSFPPHLPFAVCISASNSNSAVVVIVTHAVGLTKAH